MLVRPSPLPDELDRSYLGRFMRMNGKRNEKEAMALAATWSRDSERSGRNRTKVELLSEVSGLDVRDFVCAHTTLPLRRAITANHLSVLHGDPAHPTLLLHSALRTARPGAFYCPDCATQDQEVYGTSYWHRSHHIPGQYWCFEHGSPLYFLNSEEALLLSPLAHSENARQIDGKWVSSLQAKEAHQKFLDISLALMNRDSPCSAKRVGHRLRQRAIDYGLCFDRGAQLLSEAIFDVFDDAWLQEVLPTPLKDQSCTTRAGIEGMLDVSTAAYLSPVKYILVASLLCENADDAMETFTATGRKPRRKKEAESFDATLKALYLRHCGDHQAIADEMKLPPTMIYNRLGRLGLPHLADGTGVTFDFLLKFFVEGESLHQSKLLSDISESQLESVLRAITGSFTNTLCDIHPAPRRHGEAKKLPIQAGFNIDSGCC